MKKYLQSLRDVEAKLLISIFFVVSNLCIPKTGFLPLGAEDFDILPHLIFPLCHANIFHLVCNLWCMWLLRPPYYICSGVVVSFLCSLLPEVNAQPIMGMSGVLFSIIGAKYGERGMVKNLVKNTWLFFIVTAFLPNVACLFHLYCIAMGYLWGKVKKSRQIKREVNNFKLALYLIFYPHEI